MLPKPRRKPVKLFIPRSERRLKPGMFLIVIPISLLLWVLILAACLPLLGGCQTTASAATRPETAPPATCLAFKPIRWSRADTFETQKQARAHNAAGVSLCGWKP